jgi:hypothetical protein
MRRPNIREKRKSSKKAKEKPKAQSARERLVNPEVSDAELATLFARLDSDHAAHVPAQAVALKCHCQSKAIDDSGILERFARYVHTRSALRDWIRAFTTLTIPRHAVCPNHNSPFDYLAASYFEPAKDIVVWAPRGGGKTRLAALATLLDLIHKPGIAVRILGGSLEQSLRMWEHLMPDLLRCLGDEFPKGNGRSFKLRNKSSAAVLTQSQRAVRGLRVQKMRCDEVELFKPEIWEAAQLVTKSLKTSKERRVFPQIRGCIEAISTLHEPFGLMNTIIEQSSNNGVPLVRWCLLDVLEKCPPERECQTCPLHEECQGVAKDKCEGFVSIDDAIAMKKRVSRDTWEAEMLCRRPSVRGCVFPHFDPAIHVRETISSATNAIDLSIDFGFSNPFVCLWIATCDDGAVHVIDEYVQPQRMLSEHLVELAARSWGTVRHVYCDPAGSARNEQTAASDVSCLRKAGYRVKYSASRIVDGLELMRAALCPAWGSSKLFIHPRCQKLIRALRSYRYAPGGSELPLKDGEHDHLIDALRYFFINHQRPMRVTSRRY